MHQANTELQHYCTDSVITHHTSKSSRSLSAISPPQYDVNATSPTRRRRSSLPHSSVAACTKVHSSRKRRRNSLGEWTRGLRKEAFARQNLGPLAKAKA